MLGAVCGYWYANHWFHSNLEPMPEGEPFLVRYDDGKAFVTAVNELADEGVIRSERAFRLYCRMNEKEIPLATGTYEFRPGMTVEEVLTAMQSPLTQMVRIKEGRWIKRVAQYLADANVCTAEEFIALANDPSHFEGVVEFPLPEDSLEGYLYPDTYDFPPLYGAENAIRTMLVTFEKKVWDKIWAMPDEKWVMLNGLTGNRTYIDYTHILTMASLIELEAGTEKDRPLIAGVIYNRLRENMTLDLDATVMYSLQEWRKLEAGEVRRVESPYNTYLNTGLPPGPIGSPAWRSIEAALNPVEHGYYYYYAPPGSMEHIFTKSYDEHRRAIKNPERFTPPPAQLEESATP